MYYLLGIMGNRDTAMKKKKETYSSVLVGARGNKGNKN